MDQNVIIAFVIALATVAYYYFQVIVPEQDKCKLDKEAAKKAQTDAEKQAAEALKKAGPPGAWTLGKLIEKGGNNGSVDCSTFCKNVNGTWGTDKYSGSVYGYNKLDGKFYAADYGYGAANSGKAADMSCGCAV
jgi:hypothetical protein